MQLSHRTNPVDIPVRFRLYLASSPEVSSPFVPARLTSLSRKDTTLETSHIQFGDLHILDPMVSTADQCMLEIGVPHGDEELTIQGKALAYDRNPEWNVFRYRVRVQLPNGEGGDPKVIERLLTHGAVEQNADWETGERGNPLRRIFRRFGKDKNGLSAPVTGPMQ